MGKSIITSLIVTIFVFSIISSSTIFAKNDDNPGLLNAAIKQNSPKSTTVKNNINQKQDEDEEDEDESESGEKVMVQNTVRNMEKLMEQINNPEDKEEVREMAQNQIRIEEKTQTALEKMDARPGFLKFLLGPDYKNAGEVRSNLVQLQNQEKQMTKLRERLENADEIAALDEAIAEVQTEITDIMDELSTKLSGFSLFGWLSKLLTGYSPTPEITIIPSPTSTVSSSPEI